MAKYAVNIRHQVIDITGPHQDIRLNDRRVRAQYRVAGDTYHIVRLSERRVNDDVIANVVINHAQGLGFRGMDIVRLGSQSRHKRAKAHPNQLGLFDLDDGGGSDA